MLNKQKGITLIALIITIIVMLILVGVTINVAFNGGLFDTTREAAKEEEKGAIYDQIISAMNVRNNGTIDVKGTYEDAKEILTAQGKTVALVEPESEGEITDNTTSVIFTVTGKYGTFKYQITDTEIKIIEEDGGEGPQPPQPEPQIEISMPEIEKEIEAGETAEETLTATLKNATTGELIWTVEPENSGITISGEGNTKTITMTKATEATIKVTYSEDESIYSTCSIKVTEKVKVEKLAELVEPTNYGDPIAYSANGIEDWKVFYNDGTNVFIITSDCIPYEKIPQSLRESGIVNASNGIYWQNITTRTMSTLDKTKTDKFMAEWVMDSFTDEKKGDQDIIMGSDLLDTNAWSSFVTTEIANAGGMAIGTPTAEMWIESWNSQEYDIKLQMIYYPEREGETLYGDGILRAAIWKEGFNRTDLNGMAIIKNTNTGFSNQLYWGENGLNYLLSSLVATDTETKGIGAVDSITYASSGMNFLGQLEPISNSNANGGLRPVVCLPANAVATLQNGTWTNLSLIQ